MISAFQRRTIIAGDLPLHGNATMQLIFEPSRGRWEAITKYGEPAMGLPKSVGFKWAPDIKRWHSADALAALKLREYADEATQSKLDEVAATAKVAADTKAKAAADTVVASRATDAAIELPVPEGLSYLPFQRAGISYAIGRNDTLIADEPGLGKTIQSLGVANVMLAEREGNLSILIVGPKISLWNWSKETAKWLTRPHTIAVWTAKKQPTADVVIVNYDVVARPAVAAALRARTWDLGVFDEAHALKNPKSSRTKAVLGFRSRDADERVEPIKATRRLFLTGTPVLNRPIELFPILNAMNVPEAQNFWNFATRYCAAYRTDYGIDTTGSSNLVELQDVLRSQVMVRRLKADVLTELPPKRYSVVQIEADTAELRRAIAAEQKAQSAGEASEAKLQAKVTAARAGGDDAALKAAVSALRACKLSNIAEVSRLRHDTAVAKIPQVIEHITAFLDGSDESILVMAHHRDVIDGIVLGLASAGHDAAVITGETSAADRIAAEEDIQNRRKRVFVGSMHACGVAITLHAASTVTFAEQDWTPGIMSQAADRAHRIGQVNSVLVQHLVVDGSVDVTMAQLVASKGGVIDAALDDLETTEDREARLAAEQAVKDAKAEAALAEARAAEAEEAKRAEEEAERARERADQQARRAEDRADVEAIQTAERIAAAEGRAARLEASIAQASSALGAVSVPGPDAVAAIHEGLRLLTEMDADHATERNGQGFSKSDSYHGHYLARLDTLLDAEAIVGRELVRRYQRQLEAHLVAMALDEPVRIRPIARERVDADAVASVLAAEPEVVALEAVAAPVVEVVESMIVVQPVTEIVIAAANHEVARRGRPSKASQGLEALSKAERNRRWRESRDMADIEVPGSLAERLRKARDARGLTMEALLGMALDALDGQGIVQG